jgi:hypothetical protein
MSYRQYEINLDVCSLTEQPRAAFDLNTLPLRHTVVVRPHRIPGLEAQLDTSRMSFTWLINVADSTLPYKTNVCHGWHAPRSASAELRLRLLEVALGQSFLRIYEVAGTIIIRTRAIDVIADAKLRAISLLTELVLI